MLKKISYNLHRVEKMPYYSYGMLNYSKNQSANPFDDAKNQDKFVQKTSTNPFNNEKENKYQKDFEEDFRNIELFLKRTKHELTKGTITSIISDATLEAGALVSGFLYDKKLPKNSFLLINKGKKSIKTLDEDKNLLMDTDIKNGDISKIKLYKNDYNYEIEFQNKRITDRLFNNNKLTLKQFKKFNKDGSLVEQIKYSKSGKIESYLLNENDSTKEFLFDTSQYALNSDFVPICYNQYKNNLKTKSLKYSYALPTLYKEYDETTSKITKIFKLQGLKPKVHKYSLFNSLNGNLITSGTI